MICPVCRREARFWGWFDPTLPLASPRLGRSLRKLCSRTCVDICHRRRGMVDPTEHEVAAMRAASPLAGEHVDSLGKTDLAEFSEQEWMTLIEVIVTAYVEALQQLAAEPATGPAPDPDPGVPPW